jgi:hypothetical protein
LTATRGFQKKHAYLAWFVLHFLLLVTVSCREEFLWVSHGLTVLPTEVRGFSRKAENASATVLALHLPEWNPVRQIIATYLGLAGIDAGYGYFAPNVPKGYKLVFELHYRDGHNEERLPNASASAAGLRLASLLDQIGRTDSDALREYMIKKLAAVTWREHPDVITMRASLLQRVEPAIRDYEGGKRETYALLYGYDFSLSPKSPPAPQR